MSRSIPVLRSRARVLQLDGFSYAQIARRLQDTKEAWHLVTRTGPLPLKTMGGRAA